MTRARLLVVGAGITGLAAAYEAVHAGARVTVVEGADRAGGRILTTPFAGLPLDAGPDAFLARVPHATELCQALGLGDDLVAPAVRAAYVWTGRSEAARGGPNGRGGPKGGGGPDGNCGELRPFPERLLLGVPTDLEALARSGAVSPAGVARAAEDLQRPADGPVGAEDESVGSLIRRRLGPEVLDTLVDPLLSGIFAGDTDRLSLLAGAPQLAAAARAGPSLIAGARALMTADGRPDGTRPDTDQPVFLTLVGGLGRLVDALVAEVGRREGRVLLGHPLTNLTRRPGGGFEARLGGRHGAGPATGLEADAVVLTCPAPVAATLVAGLAPAAGRRLAEIDYASVVLVSFAFDDDPADVPRPLDGSGFLVSRSSGLLMTACSWSSAKFAHLGGDGRVRLRVSAGRWGVRRAPALDDRQLVDVLRGDLATTMGITAEPSAVRISRWPASLPQYTVGHLDRLDEVEAALDRQPGLAVTGAAFRGVGLPACIAQGRAAARSVLARLG